MKAPIAWFHAHESHNERFWVYLWSGSRSARHEEVLPRFAADNLANHTDALWLKEISDLLSTRVSLARLDVQPSSC